MKLESANPQLATDVKSHFQTKFDFRIVRGLANTISVSGKQLSSRHNPKREAEVQASFITESKEIYLYGVGLGYLSENLLTRAQLSKLNIKILNLSLFSLVLSLRDQGTWISDERVYISLASSDLDLQTPYFAFHPDVLLADDRSQNIKNLLYINNCDHFSKKQFKRNESSLLKRVQENHAYIERDKGVEHLRNISSTQEAIVVGAGPSLELNIPKIQSYRFEKQQPIIISVGTASKLLVENGIVPDYVVIVDKDISISHPLVADFSKMMEASLLYSPLVQPDLIKAWYGDRYVAYSASPLFDKVKEIFPKGSLFSGGSVIHTAIDLARNLGCKSITLFGADFAYTGTQTHAGHESGTLTNYENITPANQANRWVKDGNGNDIPTHDSFISYLIELERYIERHPDIKFWNSSKTGAFIRGCNLIVDHA
ncbi:MAG: DUF115 domain-containing protein [Paracoccaceae bacterium]|nr:DUF115 domain-containing protein [Paracoccaceae bacterium]